MSLKTWFKRVIDIDSEVRDVHEDTLAESPDYHLLTNFDLHAVKIHYLPHYGTDLPALSKQTVGSAGYDLRAALQENEQITLNKNERVLVPTGISLEIPQDFQGEVRPRSGLAVKNGVTVLNTPGTVDSDYRGEVKVCLINLGDEPFVIKRGERIAQLVFSLNWTVRNWVKVSDLSTTERGAGGFGSTGV